MQIATQITNTFETAKDRLPELAQRWIHAAVQLGAKLPASGLMMSIQREGSFDLVLRCMEDEHATAPDFFAFRYQRMLSEYWISGLYDTLRLLRDRKLLKNETTHMPLFADVELVRMGVDKHEIAKDRDLETLLQQLVRHPFPQIPPGGSVYDPKDPQRAQTPPVTLWQNGSVAWRVFDVRSNANRWVNRRDVSEQVLSLWGVMEA